MPSPTIRPATAADAPMVLALVRELAGYERLLDEVVADEAMLEQALFGAAPRVFCDIAEWQGEPVGLALWYYSFSTFAGRHGIYLEDLFVHPAFRGHGLGKALLAGLAQRCMDENLARLEWSVLDWNAPAIDFYTSQGAQMLEGWTRARISDAGLAQLAGRA